MFAYFDIGGSKTRVAVGEDGHTFCEPIKFDTPQNFDEGIRVISEAIVSLSGGRPLRAAGGGVAGPFDEARSRLVNSPNLPQWIDQPVQRALSDALKTPVFLNNDSAVVGLGEAHHGAGQGDRIMAYLTVSTGVGGVRIVEGRIDTSVFGFEPGHQLIDIDRTVFPNTGADEAEEFLSGTATEARFHKKPFEVTDPQVWEELARLLAYMLNNTIVHWSPTSVVLGGSMIVGDPAIPLERVEHYLAQVLTIFPRRPVIKQAKLRDVGGLYGAMTYVGQMLEENGNMAQ